MENNKEKTVSLPIDKMSYSGLTQLLRNPLIFKLKYILGVYNSKSGMSAVIGQACHEALRFYYGGNKDVPVPADRDEAREIAIEIGAEHLNKTDDSYIKYGKTGSREKLLDGYNTAMRIYFEEEPEYKNIFLCEERLEAEIKNHDGQIFPLPAVGKPDLVIQNDDGSYDIVDHKFVTAFTKYEDEDGEPYDDYIKIIQSKFLDYLLKETKGIQAKRVIFREVKRSRNRDTSINQIQDYIIPLDHSPYDIIFINLYNDVVKFISNKDSIYLPNLSDQMDGDQAGILYAQGLLTSDMSDVEVMHKVKDVQLVSKKFVPSKLDKVENKNLLPEEKIKLRLAEFGIPVQPVENKIGASVIQYRFKVSAGVSMTKFKKYKDDIARAIEAKTDIRILAPIPGTALVGVEVPIEERETIYFDKKYLEKDTMNMAIGMTINGDILKEDLREMPHLLIAGSTGSGKSVLLHNIIDSLAKQMSPDKMQMVLIDPKRVELKHFAKLKHLDGKVLVEYKDIVRKLITITDEMEERYKILENKNVRDITGLKGEMSYKVVIVDEFADLILRSKVEEKKQGTSYASKTKGWLFKEIKKKDKERTMYIQSEYTKDDLIEILEEIDSHDDINREDANIEYLITRLAQMGRAVGIHLIIATQRPSVDVITGLIKANFSTRIALTTSSAIDSEIILGKTGAEKLAGKGDMIYSHPARQGEIRCQSFMISKKIKE